MPTRLSSCRCAHTKSHGNTLAMVAPPDPHWRRRRRLFFCSTSPASCPLNHRPPLEAEAAPLADRHERFAPERSLQKGPYTHSPRGGGAQVKRLQETAVAREREARERRALEAKEKRDREQAETSARNQAIKAEVPNGGYQIAAAGGGGGSQAPPPRELAARDERCRTSSNLRPVIRPTLQTSLGVHLNALLRVPPTSSPSPLPSLGLRFRSTSRRSRRRVASHRRTSCVACPLPCAISAAAAFLSTRSTSTPRGEH